VVTLKILLFFFALGMIEAMYLELIIIVIITKGRCKSPLSFILQCNWLVASQLLMFAFHYFACSCQKSRSASSAAIEVVCQAEGKRMGIPEVQNLYLKW